MYNKNMETKFLIIKKHRIAYFEQSVQDAEFGVIIVHGTAEHKGRYIDFIEQLTENNISVFAMDLRGHGESAGKRGDAKSFKQLLQDFDCFVEHIRRNNPDLKLILFGHSFGGQICLAHTGMFAKVDGLILSSPLFDPLGKAGINKFVTKNNMVLKTILFNLIPHRCLGFIRMKKKHSESAQMLEVNRKDNLACHSFSLRLVGIMFKEGSRCVKRVVSKVVCPTLVVAGKFDPLVSYLSTENMYEQLQTENKKLIVYENVKHRIVQNEGAPERIDEIIDWIKSN